MDVNLFVSRVFQPARTRRLIHGVDSITPAAGLELLCAFFALLLAPLPCLAIAYAPATTLSTEDSLQLGFGSALALSGGFSLIGDPYYGDPGFPPFEPNMSYSGAVFVFQDDGAGNLVEHPHPITASDGKQNDRFGTAVAVSGDIAVVGAPEDDEDGMQNSGSAYVFQYIGGVWVEQAKLTAEDAQASDAFGSAVAISGDTILIGAPRFYGHADPGAAYVFRFNGANWSQEDKLTSSDAAVGDEFGKVIALSGDTAAFGVPDADATNDLGVVYVFRYNGVNDWVQEDELSAPADSATAISGASFAETLAISGDTLLIGAERATYEVNTAARVGAVYAYRYDGVDSWDQEAKLVPSIPAPRGFDHLKFFGRSIAFSGDIAVIGAQGGVLSTYSGAAYAFWYDGADWVEQDKVIAPGSNSSGDAHGNFGRNVALSEATILVGSSLNAVYHFKNIPDAKLTADDGATSDYFGVSVALSGDTALVGAPRDDDDGDNSGSAYLYEYDGANWIDEDKLTASDAGTNGQFGTAVALADGVAMVGAAGEELVPGAVYAFHHNGSSWVQKPALTPSDSAVFDNFGSSLAISDDRAVIGAPFSGYTEFEEGHGAAYVFEYIGGSWVQKVKLTASDGADNDLFGASVAISGDTIVVGAPEVDNLTGAAYVFRYTEDGGGSWSHDPRLSAADGAEEDGFGISVAVSSDTIVVASPGAGGNNGAAYVYGDNGVNSTWEITLTASDGEAWEQFGASVAISGDNTIVVGADYDDAGSAYVFWHDGESWVEEPKITPPDGAEDDFFGDAVAISGDSILAGAWHNENKGAAYISTIQFVSVPEPSPQALSIAALATLAFVARRKTLPRLTLRER